MRPAEERFDVFLCHKSADKPSVKAIAKRLRERGIHPWLDAWELQPGLPWQRELERQIVYENFRSAAVFVGPSGLGPWQEMELEAYLREIVFRQCPVIPVILPGCTGDKPDLPIFLKGMTWVDFREDDPEEDPLDRLIWGITGKKPDHGGGFGLGLPTHLPRGGGHGVPVAGEAAQSPKGKPMEKKTEVLRGTGTLNGNSFQEATPVRYQIDIYRKVIPGHPQSLGSKRLTGSIEMLGEWPKSAIILAFHNREDLILTLEDGGEATVAIIGANGGMTGMSPHLPITVAAWRPLDTGERVRGPLSD